MRFETRAVQPLTDFEFGAVVPPIHLSSTFRLDPETLDGPFDYQRGANPTRNNVEDVLAHLDSAKYGFAYATGMAAIAATFSTLKEGDDVILSASVYGGTFRFVTNYFPRHGITWRFVDDPGELTDADFTENTKILFVESPTNPTLRVVDIAGLAGVAHRNGAKLYVDNTFMTPYLQRPLELGADVVVQSGTKYLGGLSDLLAGVVTTSDEDLAEEFSLAQKAYGGVLEPFTSFRLFQGIKSLPLRLAKQQENAKILTDFLLGHDAVSNVLFPGWYSPEEAAIHAQQAGGPGAVLSFEVAGDVDRIAFLRALRIPAFAVSLGGVETLICHPATMTHEELDDAALENAGISHELLRLSVGIEHPDDLVEDFDQALKASTKR